jgi:uncharacterized protein (DUF2384 family)
MTMSENDDIEKLAAKIFGDTAKARAWLGTPIKALGDRTAASKLRSADGVDEVMAVLRKIQAGEST